MSIDPSNWLVGDYDATNGNNEPTGGRSRKDGNDHLQGLKGTLKRTFPNLAAAPNGVVTPDQDQLNALTDYVPASGTVESRLAALEAESAKFPGGGVVFLMFRNAVSVIPGWTQATDAAYDGAILRVINDASTLSEGGTRDPVSMTGADVPRHTHPASVGGAGTHDHPIYDSSGSGSSQQFIQTAGEGDASPVERNSGPGFLLIVPGRGGHTHTATVSENTSNPVTWEPKYFDGIVASKD